LRMARPNSSDARMGQQTRAPPARILTTPHPLAPGMPRRLRQRQGSRPAIGPTRRSRAPHSKARALRRHTTAPSTGAQLGTAPERSFREPSFGSRARPARPVHFAVTLAVEPLSCRWSLRTRRRSRRRRPCGRRRQHPSERRWDPARSAEHQQHRPTRTACWPWRALPSPAARARW